MTLPNFLIIGAAKSGTTAIHSYINQHPDVFMPARKELRFFSYTETASKEVPAIYTHQGVTSLTEYQRYFKAAGERKVVGEASPMYLYTPGTAERIRQVIPRAKMLVILRNPIERAYSAYLHANRDWIEPASSFKEALALEQERIDSGWGMLWHYTQAGFYSDQLKRYYDNFDSDQIKVVLYDDLISNMSELLADIFEFLDVDPTFKPDTTSRLNVSGFPISKNYHKFLYQLMNNEYLGKEENLNEHLSPISKNTLHTLRSINLGKKTIPDDIRKELIPVFTEDIKKLEGLIHRDLSFWVK